MTLLATHQCYEVKQVVSPLEKRYEEHFFDMNLYDDMITVKHDKYPITTIFDISYRRKEEQGAIGYIYLHTSRGVRTYYIKEEPASFIDAYIQLKATRPELQ
ncbi:hypothetical protein ACERII_20730 [Evansella sp. AB-rgal1]|uniref:hypothetical protein n=1 Tax=Evansella sp. AB-rgal1 TaxID=3242696 RepID=UPI00359F0061